ncbi:hypothetical protein [Streptomyces sp. NPDC050504]|uniref:hypothetical protein n=1 Tax=Streptomyces sp. NPDC050504 TaxID=3365618 RepID=UPI0037A593F2
MAEQETWTSDEFGSSHEGWVGVLLEDGTVPEPVLFVSSSGPESRSVSQWSVYNGKPFCGPRAAALRAVCSCGWTGPEHRLDWDVIGDQDLARAAADPEGTCTLEWDRHTTDVGKTAVPVPEPILALLERLEGEIEELAKSAPLAALRAVRSMEVLAGRLAHWPAHDVRNGMTVKRAGDALGLNERDTRKLLARFGSFSPYF